MEQMEKIEAERERNGDTRGKQSRLIKAASSQKTCRAGERISILDAMPAPQKGRPSCNKITRRSCMQRGRNGLDVNGGQDMNAAEGQSRLVGDEKDRQTAPVQVCLLLSCSVALLHELDGVAEGFACKLGLVTKLLLDAREKKKEAKN